MVLRRIGRPGQRVMARKPHVAYFAGMEYVPLPFQDTFTDFLAAVGESRADYLFISGIEATLDPQLGVLADSGVALPALRPIAHGAVDSTRFFSLYRVVPTITTVAEVEDSLLVAIRRFAARRPGQAWPQTYLGGHLVTMGRYREALAPLDLSERLDPKDSRVARFQAIAHAELLEYEPAAAACERAIQLGGAGDWEMAYLGHIRLMQGRPGEARDLLRQGVAAAPTNTQYLSEYLQACARSGAWAEAAQASDQLLRLAAGDATARLIGARAWLRTGHPDRARSLAEMGGTVTGPDSVRWAVFADSLRRGTSRR